MTLRSASFASLTGQDANAHGTLLKSAFSPVNRWIGSGAALSPDGSQFVLADRVGGAGGIDLFVYNTGDGSFVRRLTTDGETAGAINGFPDISPDGTTVAYSSDVGTPGVHDLYVINIDGSTVTPTNLTNTSALSEVRPSYSPDGLRFALTRDDIAGSPGLLPGESANLNIYLLDCSEDVEPFVLNHFLCYKTVATTPFSPPSSVSLIDQFETKLVSVQKSVSLCNPANKEGEDPDAVTDSDHLQAYPIKATPGQPPHAKQTNIRIDNQFGTIRVDTIKPSRLLVPTAKSLTGPVDEPTPGIDHFACYTVRVTPGTPKVPPGTVVEVEDQFDQTKDFVVVKPTRLCNPVNKNGESPGAEEHDEHLVCYQIRPATGEPKHEKVFNIHTNNQFGPAQVKTVKEEELCVPSTKTLP